MTDHDHRRCAACSGAGVIGLLTCPRCDGTGYARRIVTRSISIAPLDATPAVNGHKPDPTEN